MIVDLTRAMRFLGYKSEASISDELSANRKEASLRLVRGDPRFQKFVAKFVGGSQIIKHDCATIRLAEI